MKYCKYIIKSEVSELSTYKNIWNPNHTHLAYFSQCGISYHYKDTGRAAKIENNSIIF